MILSQFLIDKEIAKVYVERDRHINIVYKQRQYILSFLDSAEEFFDTIVSSDWLEYEIFPNSEFLLIDELGIMDEFTFHLN